MKPLRLSDFRARRFMLENRDFAISHGRYSGPTDLIDRKTWRSIIGLPDDVSVRTSDRFGPQLAQIWDYWGLWVRIVLGVQELTRNPRRSATAIAASDASDEFQATTYCALVGYYRVAFSCLRNVLEQMTISTQMAISGDKKALADWRKADERVKFGWAADVLPRSKCIAGLEQHMRAVTKDSLFGQKPKGMARRLFVELSRYTHGAAGFTDGDFRLSNGPIFVPEAFLRWHTTTLKILAIALHELKLVHPKLDELPYGPPRLTLDEFRLQVVTAIPRKERIFFESLAKFWQ